MSSDTPASLLMLLQTSPCCTLHVVWKKNWFQVSPKGSQVYCHLPQAGDNFLPFSIYTTINHNLGDLILQNDFPLNFHMQVQMWYTGIKHWQIAVLVFLPKKLLHIQNIHLFKFILLLQISPVSTNYWNMDPQYTGYIPTKLHVSNIYLSVTSHQK